MAKKCSKVFSVIFVLSFLMGSCEASLGEKNNYNPQTIVLENGGISSLAAVNEILYVLTAEGLFKLTIEKGEYKTVLLNADINSAWNPGSLPGVDILLQSKGKLYALNSDNMKLYELIITGDAVEQVFILQIEHLQQSSIDEVFISDAGEIVFLINGVIYQINMQTKVETTLDGESLVNMAPYKNGLYIALETRRVEWKLNYCLITLNTLTGTREIIKDLGPDTRFYSMAYSEALDEVFLADRNKIYSFNYVENLRESGFFVQGDSGKLVLINDDYGAVAVDEKFIAITNIASGSKSAQSKIMLLDPVGRGDEYIPFIQTYSNIQIIFANNNHFTSEEYFIQQVLSQGAQVDIYVLTDQNLLNTIKEKGYAVDLAKNETIKKAIEDMYPPFRQAFSNDQGIYALPKRLFLPILSYNKMIFHQLGTTAPTTYHEYFDFCIVWLEEYAWQYPEYRLNAFENGMDIWSLMKKYADEMEKNNKEIHFNTSFLSALLDKYLKVEELLQNNKQTGELNLFGLTDLPSQGSFAYLPLTFEKTNEFCIDISSNDFFYYIINPYSENKEEALLFLENYIQNIEDVYVKALLFSSNNEPVENKEYEKNLVKMEEELESLNRLMEEEEAENKKIILSAIETKENVISQYKKSGQWLLTKEELELYNQYAGNIFINPFNPVIEIQKEYPSLFNDMVVNLNQHPSKFLEELDRKTQMMFHENNY